MVRFACGLVALPALLAAQTLTVGISGTPTCARCRVETTRLFTVGPIPGAHPGRDSEIARDSAGQYLVVVEPGPRVAVLDSTGAFVRFLPWTSTRADTTARHVNIRVDFSGYISIYDSTAGITMKEGRTVSSMGFLDDRFVAAATPPGLRAPVATTTPAPTAHATFATWGMRADPARPGPFGAARPAAPPRSIPEFELDSVVSNPACRDCRDLLVDGNFGFDKAAFWGATADEYRIDLFYSTEGVLTQSIDVFGSWLPLGTAAAYPAGRVLPEAPRLMGLAFDQSGCGVPPQRVPAGDPLRTVPCERRLWVSGLVFADSASADEQRRYATMIDVIGGSAPRIFAPPTPIAALLCGCGPYTAYGLTDVRMITRTRLAGRMELLAPGLAYQHRQLANGDWTIDLYRLSVVQP